jgi:2-polyprenyl-3-methyl-5-hydroxy-6-metoxy-1,4-benzoquinol methylase
VNRNAFGQDPKVRERRYESENLRKYESSNRVVQYLLQRFLGQLTELAAACEANHVLDVGCGEGLVSQTLRQHGSGIRAAAYLGVDHSFGALQVAAQWLPRVQLGCMGADSLAFRDGVFDLVLCIEVLEHVPDPRAMLAELRRVSSRYCIISVPHEPFFSWGNLLRGRHMLSWGDHPEHIHHWGPRPLHELLSQFFVVKKLTRPFPWLMALCER